MLRGPDSFVSYQGDAEIQRANAGQAELERLQGLFPDGPDRETIRATHHERVEEIELTEGAWVDFSEAREQQV